MTPISLAVATVISSLALPSAEYQGLPSFDDAVLLATVAFNEMEGQSPTCKGIVVQAALNRYAMIDGPLREVTHRPFQFATHRPDVDADNPMEATAALQAAEAAVFVYSGLVKVPAWARGVTHFHEGRVTPSSWGPNIVKIGYDCGHTFYQEVVR